MFRALLDTCVLFKPLVCDTLLCIAEEELFQPLWSEDILDELRRSLLRYGVAKSGVDHRIGQMVEHFPGAMVTGHHSLINAMTNHSKDRHVLAAAVRGRADLIVTQNISDFPMGAVAPYDVEVTTQDGSYSAGVAAGGSQAPVVNSWVRTAKLSRPHLVAVDR